MKIRMVHPYAVPEELRDGLYIDCPEELILKYATYTFTPEQFCKWFNSWDDTSEYFIAIEE